MAAPGQRLVVRLADRLRKCLLSLEPGVLAYRADTALYAGAVAGMAAFIATAAPREDALRLSALGLAGLLAWSLIEYLLHRFVMHGLQPFRRWHLQHHLRPHAPIFTPTLASAALLLGLVFLPARLWLGLWSGCALTLGVLAGYLAYGLTHHATHHWRGQGRWLMRRKQWHARHHRTGRATCCYGVSSGFWDQVFRSAR